MQVENKKKLSPIQKTYRYLNKIQHIDAMITRKQEQIDSLRSLATSTAMHTDSERVQSSGTKDKIGDCISKVADLCVEINNDIDSFCEIKADIMHTIDILENLDERNVLYYIYFNQVTYRQISKEMHISESTVYRLHKAAIKNVSVILFGEDSVELLNVDVS